MQKVHLQENVGVPAADTAVSISKELGYWKRKFRLTRIKAAVVNEESA